MMSKNFPGKVTVIYQLPEQLKGAEKLFLYERSNLDKGTEIVVDRDKVTLIFEKGGEYVLAKEKDKAAGETEKEDTEDKKEVSKNTEKEKKHSFQLPKLPTPVLVAAGVALAALIGLIVIMLMEARARKIREAKRQKIRGEKGELSGIIEEISSEEADPELEKELDSELAEREEEAKELSESQLDEEEKAETSLEGLEEEKTQVLPALPLVENIPDPEEEALLKKEEEDWNKIHEAQSQGAAEVSEIEQMPETEVIPVEEAEKPDDSEKIEQKESEEEPEVQKSEPESSKKEKDDTQKDE